MPIKFEKAKRRFDVTVKIQYENGGKTETAFEGSLCVWSYSPSLRQMTDPILEESRVDKFRSTRISILYLREHEFSEYSAAQMGKMMAQEGFGFSDNPYVENGAYRGNEAQADTWGEAYRKEMSFINKRSN